MSMALRHTTLPGRPRALLIELMPNGGYLVSHKGLDNGMMNEPRAAFTELKDALTWIEGQMSPKPGDGAPLSNSREL